jgi:ribosome-binding protein aMBF1 (putative translation factor)
MGSESEKMISVKIYKLEKGEMSFCEECGEFRTGRVYYITFKKGKSLSLCEFHARRLQKALKFKIENSISFQQ